MSYYNDLSGNAACDGCGEYEAAAGMGAVPATQQLPAGTELAAGYRVVGLPQSAAAGAPAVLRAAMQAGFLGTTVRTGWGGGGDAAGVPSGTLYAVVRTGRALTGADMNSIFARVGQALQSRLGNVQVTNTHAHVVGGAPAGGGTGPGASLVPDPVTGLINQFTTDPNVPPGQETMLPQENFFTQDVGGIPMWGILLGGTAALGGLAYMLMRRPSAAVKANAARKKKASKKPKKKAPKKRLLGRDVTYHLPGMF
jgi:hypothetical protein